MAVTITTDGAAVTLDAPYSPDLPKRARELGGKFDYGTKTWVFDNRDEDAVRALAREVYGTDGGDADEPTVTIRIDVNKALSGGNDDGELLLCGAQIARRWGRDRDVTLGPGVVVMSGRFPGRGGSVKNPRLAADDDTVVEVRDVARGTALTMVDQHRGVTLVDDDLTRREALQAERERLVQRINEIDNELA